MSERMKRFAGTLVAAALIMDGLIHVYWSTGSIWPAPDSKTLSLAVLNMNVSFGLLIVGPLAVLLFCSAMMVLARVNRLGKVGYLIPDSFLQWGMLALAAGFFLRFAAGIVWMLGIGADTGTIFYRLNLLLYTPICLVLFVSAMVASRYNRSNRKLKFHLH